MSQKQHKKRRPNSKRPKNAGDVSPRARGTRPAGRQVARHEIVSLHRQIFAHNQARINESVTGYTPAFRRYEREYAEAVHSYQRRARFAELDRALAGASIAYVGDYHTLPQAQRTVIRLMRRLPPYRSAVLALEFVQGRYQRVLDEYMRGHLPDEVFLEGIGHARHWVFGGWESFRDLLHLARERGYRALAIDSLGRGKAGSTLEARDRYAARRIAASVLEQPDALHIVLVGELHVAPPHLPQVVQDTIGSTAPRHVIVYQNSEEIYWQLEAKGLEHDTELVRVAPDQYCLMNTPPIVCQQSFLNWLDADEEGEPLDAPEENFKAHARMVAELFNLELGDALESVEINTVVDLSFLEKLRRRGDFTSEDIQKIQEQILRSESLYIPRARMVYLGNLSVNHSSEEATHFLRHHCSGSREPPLMVDAFYARVLEEAVGFLGSKLVNHKRKCAHVPHLEHLMRSRHAHVHERQMARLVLKHVRMEAGQRVRNLLEVYNSPPSMWNAVTHVLGYRLGDHLYYALIRGDIAKDELRDLFFEDFEQEGAALSTYLYLSARMQGVALPERF